MKRLALILLLTLAASSLANAQWYDTSPSAQTGRLPSGSYNGVGIDNVSLFNGNVSLDIPLLTIPGRELSAGLRLTYNAQKWQYTDYLGNTGPVYTGGWRLFDLLGDVPKFAPEFASSSDCPTTEHWRAKATWVDGLGSKRAYYADVNTSCTTHFRDPEDYINRTYYSTNGDGSVLIVGTDKNDLTMKFKNGNVIVFGTRTLTTSNGNYLTRDDATRLFERDTLGRTITFSTNYGHDDPNATDYEYYRWYTVTDSNGNSQTYKLNFKDNVNVDSPLASGSCSSPNAQLDEMLQSIYLPDGSLHYTFDYETNTGGCHGYLKSVTLPTGGYIHYEYNSDFVHYRKISYDGTNEETWTFDPYEYSGQLQVTVTSPESAKVVHNFWEDDGRETQTLWQDANDITVRTAVLNWYEEQKSYAGPFINLRRKSIKLSEGSLNKRTVFAYDSDLNLTQTSDTDWYTGSPSSCESTPIDDSCKISETNVEFQTINSGEPFQRAHIIELKGIDPADGTFKTQGKTEFVFDETTPSSTPYSDCPTSPSSACIVNKSTPAGARGNATTVKRYTASGTHIDQLFAYDDLGNIVSQTDPQCHSASGSPCHTTTINYSDNFASGTGAPSYMRGYVFPKTIQDPEGNVVTNQYVYYTGSIKSSTDPRGKQTTWTYDALNRIASIVAPAPGSSSGTQQTNYYYTDGSSPQVRAEVTVATGVVLKSATNFDRMQRPIQTVEYDSAGDVKTDTVYDGKGRIHQVSAPYRSGGTTYWTTTEYDAVDRPTSVSNADSTSVTYSYTANTTRETDEDGKQRRLTINALGQLTKVEEPNPSLSSPLTTTYSYYVFGPLRKVTQSSNQTRTFTYNWLGFLSSEIHPESGTTSYTPISNTLLVDHRTDNRSVTTTYTYDNNDRLKTASYSDGTPTVTRVYNHSGLEGLPYSIQDGLGTTTFSYSDAGMVLSEARGFTGVSGTFTTSYDYDQAGRLTSITYPSGRVVTRTYQSSGGIATNRLSSLADTTASTTLLQSVSENAAGQLISRALGNSAVESRNYNSRNQVTGIGATINSGSTTLLNLTYDYTTGGSNVGRIRSRTDALQPEHAVTYAYDSMYRLTGATAGSPAWGMSWVYDAYGNRTSQTPSGLATTKVGSQTLGYSSTTNQFSSGFSYDNAGNVTNDGIYNYAYDGEGRMTSVNSGAITYAYDGEGRMIKRYTSSSSTYYLYGQTGLLSEFTTTNTGATAAASSNRLEYRVTEQTATPVLLMNSAATVIENNRSFPFGERWETFAASTNEEKFTTYLRDTDTAVDYALTRRYVSAYGRFTSPDLSRLAQNPMNPQTWNLYTYVENDPVNLVDPTGEEDDCLEEGLDECLAGLTNLILSRQRLNQLRQSLQEALFQTTDVVVNFVTAPRDMNCVAKTTAVGGAGGTAAGAAAGSLGFVTGPGGVATTYGGAQLGSGAGMVVGYAYGMVSCMSSNGSGGGGGGRNTTHGDRQIAERKMSPQEIVEAKTGKMMTQADGAKVFVKDIGNGKFNVVVEGERGIITVLKHIDAKALANLARNYGWK